MIAPRAAVLLALFAVVPAAAEPAPADLERELSAWLVAEHSKLVEKCVADDLVEEARAECEEILRVDRANELAKRMTTTGRTWVLHWDAARHEKFRDYAEVRRILSYEASTRFLALGRAKRKAGNTSGAKAAFLRALDCDPEFADAHAELGEAHVEGQGWFPKAEAEKRLRGLLPISGNWLPAEEVKAKRSKWAQAWDVEGKHFTVKSNHSIEASQKVLTWAEEMCAVLIRETAPVMSPPKDMKPMPVFLFATEADFREHVAAHHPGGVSPGVIGFYSNEDRAAHFWYREEGGYAPLSTVVRHECMHQALDAWIPWANDPTLQPGFWIYEGMARWFESVENRDGKLLVGNPKHPPFQVARAMVEKGKVMTLADLSLLEQPGMADHYEEAAGVTLFFMTAGDAKYREKFLRYCAAILKGDGGRDSFEKAFGEKPDEFETAWREYLRGLK